ncbi:uncharacterized protein HMPREF1541_00401 [Cyphellophora europaea CBS 101466]|uniref:Mitochondrial thiamine pyrophosphate carrier 1 n=1 Tax=Cyphellophora europaea (strain CBS 101466) TaxID=1220924 RepID=W2SBY3_CYPE1|nr:uncharacterized protein HMPREF1541_00401 [Cyphellophora europaea CBS 101466]ETN46217.1 hypothetical protein HMPREF1541_00401 [Cyphellophora europaea CBS 101466]
MSADFWASYLSGALGILIGNRLDVLKVQAQAGLASGPSSTPYSPSATSPLLPPSPASRTTGRPANLQHLTQHFRGAAAPILGYGALNSILFMTFNRTLQLMNPGLFDYTKLAGCSLSSIWAAGALGGLATWLVSAPSELIKCRAQLQVGGQGSSYGVFREVVREGGVRALFRGGVVTSVRDAVGYGWYFWSYELCKRFLVGRRSPDWWEDLRGWEVLLAGGIAGVVTWGSVYPADAVKTRVQTQLGPERKGVWRVVREVYAEGGVRAFYRGLGVCSLRAFVVNAVQWYAYENMMAVLKAPE